MIKWDTKGLLLKPGLLMPRWQIIDMSDYPHLWVTVRELCDAMNEIVKYRLGVYNNGLRKLADMSSKDEDLNKFGKALLSNTMSRYKNIGKKTSSLICDMIKSKFVLVYRDSFDSEFGPEERWLFAINSKHEYYDVLLENSVLDLDWQQTRIRVEENSVHFLVNDVMLGIYEGQRSK